MLTPTWHPQRIHPLQPQRRRAFSHSSSSRAAQSMQKQHRVAHQKHTLDCLASCQWLQQSQVEALALCTPVMHQIGPKNSTRQPCLLQRLQHTGNCKHTPHAMWCNSTNQAATCCPLTLVPASMHELVRKKPHSRTVGDKSLSTLLLND